MTDEPAHRYARRSVRLDMGAVTKQVVTVLLEEYEDVVRFVAAKLAKRARKSAILDADDLVQVGRIALIEALITFRDDRGMKFRSWVSRVVHWRCQEALQVAVDPLDTAQLAEDMHAEAQALQFVSLHAFVGGGDEGRTIEEMLTDYDAVSPEEATVAGNLRHVIYRTIESFEHREAQVVAADLAGSSGAELGRQVGVTRQRISDQRKLARKRLKDALTGGPRRLTVGAASR
jgi:RNA polymerase sigma factor (sigma-70 family)